MLTGTAQEAKTEMWIRSVPIRTVSIEHGLPPHENRVVHAHYMTTVQYMIREYSGTRPSYCTPFYCAEDCKAQMDGWIKERAADCAGR